MQPLNCLFKARDPSRAVIALSGKGVKEFLQGLYTNDVVGADTASSQPPFTRGTAQYGCFLSGTGRTLFDGFITDISLIPSEAEVAALAAAAAAAPKPTVSSGGGLSAPPPPAGFSNEMVLVDIAANVKDVAMQHFRDFKLRRKIKIVDVSSRVNVFVESIRTAPACGAPSERARLAAKLAAKSPTSAEAVAAALEAHVAEQQAIVDSALVASDADPTEPLMVLDPRYGTAVEGTLGDFTEPPVAEEGGQEVEGELPPPLPMVLRRGYKVLSEAEAEAQAVAEAELAAREAEGEQIAPPHTQPSSSSSSTSIAAAATDVAALRAYRSVVESLCGVPANSRVFLPNKGLPFEGNIDQLWGVSFEKGCYLGQELTHRTHVMLVCRKRVVPIVLGHYNSREEIMAVEGGFSSSGSNGGDGVEGGAVKPRLTFNVDDLTLTGLDFSVPRGLVWGSALPKQDVEYILPSPPAPADGSGKEGGAVPLPTRGNRATNPANAIGNRIYVLTDPSAEATANPDPSTLTAVGHVTQGQYSVGAGLLRLRYMDATTRTMRVYIKREVTPSAGGGGCALPEYVPATAFIPLWWSEEVVTKVLTAAEVEE